MAGELLCLPFEISAIVQTARFNNRLKTRFTSARLNCALYPLIKIGVFPLNPDDGASESKQSVSVMYQRPAVALWPLGARTTMTWRAEA